MAQQLQPTKSIWVNGKFVPWNAAKIHVLTHTLHYGAGVFEGLRLYETPQGPAIFRLKDHTKRLFNSAKAIGMKIPFSEQQINEAIVETVKKNNLQSGYIRPIAFYGYGIMGLDPNNAKVDVAIACWPWGKYLPAAVKVKISPFIRIHPKSTDAAAKITGHYINSILATREAKLAGFDEALLLDYKGNIAEGPGENFFMVKRKTLYTPKLGDKISTKHSEHKLGYILPGITRASIIVIAKNAGYKVIEKDIKPREAIHADEAFLTGTAAEITPIRQINDTKIKIGLVTEDLKFRFEDIVHGKDKRYSRWLNYCQTTNN